MGLSRLSGECTCPPWLTLHSKGEAGYFDPLDTPGFLGGLFQILWRPGAASYGNQSGNGCMGISIPPAGFSRTAVGATLIRLVCPWLWWSYRSIGGCLGIPWSVRCHRSGVFPGLNLHRRCTLSRKFVEWKTLGLGGCPSTVLVVPPFPGKCRRILLGKTRCANPFEAPGVVLSSDLLVPIVLSWGCWVSGCMMLVELFDVGSSVSLSVHASVWVLFWVVCPSVHPSARPSVLPFGGGRVLPMGVVSLGWLWVVH